MTEAVKWFWVIMLVVIGGIFGQEIGKQRAAKNCTNPSIIEYRKQQLVLQPGDVACPEGHTCQWQAWDLSTDQRVLTGKERPGDGKPW